MILDQVKSDLEQALKQKDMAKAGALRFLLSEIHNQQIALRPKLQGKNLSDEDVIVVIRRESKRRQESIEAYRKGDREDLVRKEQQELEILRKYLPQEMPAEELEKIVKEMVNKVGANGPGDFGKVMGTVMEEVKGRADGKVVAEMVKKMLN